MNIYLIRHGQTDWNKKLLIQGRENNPLNECGIIQARDTAKRLEGIKADILISSSLIRAQKTLEIIKDSLKINKEMIIMDEFIERDFGELEKKETKEYYAIEDFQKVENYEQDIDIEKRVNKGLDIIQEKYRDKNDIFIVCHSHVIKAFLNSNFGNLYDYSIKLENCCVLKLETHEKVYKNLTFI